jgi:hypothetical protein
MPPGHEIARGEAADSPQCLNMTGSGRILWWIALRGTIHDWTIYCHFADRHWDWIKNWGDKVHSETHIRRLVPCDDEAFEMYRY